MRDLGARRLIPAHAGKTPILKGTHHAYRAHPRSRGENVHRGVHCPVRSGLIPAHAGKTFARARSCGQRAAHPRSRGENVEACRCLHERTGSSPLTRGKLGARSSMVVHVGLIPAHAGKTRWRCPARSCPRAHPRSRGENLRQSTRPFSSVGSSPLTRGKLPSRRNLASQDGLIPAHAGKTRVVIGRSPPGAAHPRSRGENCVESPRQMTVKGSSPLTRGKLLTTLAHQDHLGLIPAHAGKTRVGRPRRGGWRAHPRSRGENGHGRRVHLRPRGSSPLTRGKP